MWTSFWVIFTFARHKEEGYPQYERDHSGDPAANAEVQKKKQPHRGGCRFPAGIFHSAPSPVRRRLGLEAERFRQGEEAGVSFD